MKNKDSKKECCNTNKNNTEKHKCTKNNDCKQNTKTNCECVSTKEFNELKETLQRLNAEFQNYRKRIDEEKSKFIKLSNESLIKNLLPILDNFELALNNNKNEDEFSQGTNIIFKQLLNVLEQEGLQKIPITGKFNPNLHEAVLVEETDLDSGIILQELQKGYLLNDKILRNSKVKISKKKHLEVNKNE